MKPETKLWLRKQFLMALRSIVWHVDDWLHRQEVKFRDEISVPVSLEPPRPARPQGPTVSCPFPFPEDELLRHRVRGRIPRRSQPQLVAKTRRRTSAADFDLRFAER
jgi:hypothetical protein